MTADPNFQQPLPKKSAHFTEYSSMHLQLHPTFGNLSLMRAASSLYPVFGFLDQEVFLGTIREVMGGTWPPMG